MGHELRKGGRVRRPEAVLRSQGAHLRVVGEEVPEADAVRGQANERVLREDGRIGIHEDHVGRDAAVGRRRPLDELALVDHDHGALADTLHEVVVEGLFGAAGDEALAEE